MKQRLISAFFGVIVLILVLLGNQQVFDVVVTAISTIAIYEVLNAVGLKEKNGMKVVSMLFPLALIFMSYTKSPNYSIVIFLLIAVIMLIMLFNHKKYLFADTSMFVAVSVLLSISFLHVSLIRRLGNANFDVLIVLIGCWITDTCAYFSGYFFGKHKLAPEISPKKTIEGSVGGVIGVILVLLAYAFFAANIMNMSVNILSVVITGFVCGIFSQFGDLCASIIKREHNIKDFGNIMPGHGGVMDRFDSFLFVAPLVYYILKFFPIFI